MTADQGADERRIAHQLRRLGVGPDAAPAETDRDRDWLDDLYDEPDPEPEQADEPEEKPKAIAPTRIIPAGAALPARAPEPDEVPPWRPAPTPAVPPAVPPPLPPHGWYGPGPYAPPPPAPGPIEVYVTLLPAPLPPEPTRRERLTAWLSRFGRPWHAVAALALAVAPILPGGYSLATTWHYTVAETRDIWGPGWGYGLGGGALALVVYRITRPGGGPLRLLLLAITGIGAFGAIDLFAPVTALTGVHPR